VRAVQHVENRIKTDCNLPLPRKSMRLNEHQHTHVLFSLRNDSSFSPKPWEPHLNWSYVATAKKILSRSGGLNERVIVALESANLRHSPRVTFWTEPTPEISLARLYDLLSDILSRCLKSSSVATTKIVAPLQSHTRTTKSFSAIAIMLMGGVVNIQKSLSRTKETLASKLFSWDGGTIFLASLLNS